MSALALFLCALVALAHASVECPDGEKCKSLFNSIENGRLPGNAHPAHYDVLILPDIYTGAPPFNFNGNVTIYFECTELETTKLISGGDSSVRGDGGGRGCEVRADSTYTIPEHKACKNYWHSKEDTDTLYLNQYQLSFEHVDLFVDPESPIQPAEPDIEEISIENQLEMVAIQTSQPLVNGARYIASLSFSGVMPRAAGWPDGLFYDVYEEDGEQKYLAGTNFFPRGWMPCFDEPSYKSTFNVSVIRRAGVTSLMNTPFLYQIERNDGWIQDVFETTPIMPPYVVCFFVSDFDYLEFVTDSGIISRVWSRRDILYSMEFANSVAGPIIDYFQEWTGQTYPIAKMDHIAIPNMGGAMENWGLILYGESSLIVDPELSTENRKAGAAHIISHEVAHQWFGNLVTYAWWDEAWLNEGFSTFFENQSFEEVLGWDGDMMHLVDECWSIMNTDSTNRSAPVRIEVVHPWERWNAFSGQAYTKGSCVVRMFRQILGPDTFQRGISRYLSTMAYGNAVTDDLFEALEEQAEEDGVTDTDGSRLDLGEKMYSFLDQMGFPVVSARRNEDGGILLEQEQYQNPRGGYVMPPSPYEYKWSVPVTLASESDPDFSSPVIEWMNREDVELSVSVPEDEWFLLNNNGGAFVRMQYQEEDKMNVIQQLLQDHEVIPEESRALFIHDIIKLAEAGYLPADSILDPTVYLGSELGFGPWKSADQGLRYPVLMLQRFPDTKELLREYLVAISGPVYEELGWESEEGNRDHVKKLLRVLINNVACGSDDENCLVDATARFDEWQQDPQNNSPVADHRYLLPCAAISAGGQDDFDFVLQQYREVVDAVPLSLYRAVMNDYLRSMACARDSDILNSYISLAFDSDVIPARDSATVMTAIAESRDGRDVMWEHLKLTWADNPVPTGVSRGNILRSVVNGFSSAEDLVELENFISQYPPQSEADEALYTQVTNTLNANLAWTDLNQQNFHDWLQQNAA